jgi:ABC-type branched-subunit amino acid transport system substrate-binding protein
MGRVPLLLIKPAENDPAPCDQSQGARLAALYGPAHAFVELAEESFARGDLGDLEQKLDQWAGKIAGVIGATNVPKSTRLGELAAKLNILCFVANNNPSVWLHRRQIFHIGIPSRQTATVVARSLKKTGFTRVFLLSDETDFQSRVAASTVSALEENGIQARSRSGSDSAWLDEARDWEPDLLYLVFSDEERTLPLARLFRSEQPKTALLLGRSLLRSSFIASLGSAAEGVLFVDFFRRGEEPSSEMLEFTKALREERVDCPTANHGFGWDAMTLCAMALGKAGGEPLRAIEFLESGVVLEGVTGRLRFSKENHNGREGAGPTTISRWRNGRIEEAYHA